jgi:hypothetical protein
MLDTFARMSGVRSGGMSRLECGKQQETDGDARDDKDTLYIHSLRRSPTVTEHTSNDMAQHQLVLRMIASHRDAPFVPVWSHGLSMSATQIVILEARETSRAPLRGVDLLLVGVDQLIESSAVDETLFDEEVL